MKAFRRISLMLVIVLIALAVIACDEEREFDGERLTSLVDPFIGTGPSGDDPGYLNLFFEGGDVWPGAVTPLGMVAWSPDTRDFFPGGYRYDDDTIRGFSLTHFSGRGCVSYQDISFMPVTGLAVKPPPPSGGTYATGFSHDDELAHPGFYRVSLDSGVTVELTATTRTGLARWTFPDIDSPAIVIDAAASPSGVEASSITINPENSEISGSVTAYVGCSTEIYTLYFTAAFDAPFVGYGTWSGGTTQTESTESTEDAGAWIVFDLPADGVVSTRVSISFISREKAALNLATESPNFDFDHARETADAAWEKRLRLIEIKGGTVSHRRIFYTAMYHTFMHPNVFSDADGEYLGYDGQVHSLEPGEVHYHNIAAWDAYRSLIQLRSILTPDETRDIVASLLRDAEQGGHVPRWSQGNADSLGMNGDHGAAMIAIAHAFGVRDFDVNAALYLIESGEPVLRKGLLEYNALGYVAHDQTVFAAALTLEYAVDDFAIAQMASSVGAKAIAERYLSHAANWRNVLDETIGYPRPRNTDGSWLPDFSPGSMTGFEEGNAAQYRWTPTFDALHLFDVLGGSTPAVKELDDFFSILNAGMTRPHAYMGNEPSLVSPWLYALAGAPAKTQEVVRRIQTELYRDEPAGLPGNDDGGALSSWYIFSTMGLYPAIHGLGGFVVGSPAFEQLTVHMGSGTLVIRTKDWSSNAPYVHSLRVQGEKSDSVWIPWETIADGGTLEFTMSAEPTDWGTSPSAVPPGVGRLCKQIGISP